MRIAFGATGRRFAGAVGAPEISLSHEPIAQDSVGNPVQSKDIFVAQVTYASGGQVRLSSSADGTVFTTATPDLCAIDGDIASLVGSVGGVARICGMSPVGGCWMAVFLASGSATLPAVTGYDPGSLLAHCAQQTLAQAAGHSAVDASLKAWSTYSGHIANGNFSAVRNAASVVGNLNTSFVSAQRESRSYDEFPLTLISARHAITAKHTRPIVGERVVFIKADGSQEVATVQDVDIGIYGDLAVAYFAAPVAGVIPARTLPANIDAYIGANQTTLIPIIHKTRHRPNGSVLSCWVPWCSTALMPTYLSTGYVPVKRAAPLSALAPFRYPGGIGGDSGSPCFMLINGELVLVSVWSTVSSTGHVLLGMQAEVNAAMNRLATTAGDPLAGSYAMETVSLVGFNTYLV